MPSRIISPPMVGVPVLLMRCDLRAVGADRLALALRAARSWSMIHGPNMNTNTSAVISAPPVRNVR